jgi:ATP/maltotriose-dependent transcriptional regulator MalT
VLGVSAAGPAIEELLEHGLLQPFDGRCTFHPLLREFLRQKLAADDPERASAFARSAADDALEHDRPDEAFPVLAWAAWPAAGPADDGWGGDKCVPGAPCSSGG